jgi:hypothetical protein
VLLAVLAGVVLMVTVSALAGLRQVVVGPLGVVRRSSAPRIKAVRALLFVAVLIGYWQISKDKGADINTVVYLLRPLVFRRACPSSAPGRSACSAASSRVWHDAPRRSWRGVGCSTTPSPCGVRCPG